MSSAAAFEKMPGSMHLVAAEQVEFAEGSEGAPKRRRFKMIGYSGAPVQGYFSKMIVNLSGMKVRSGRHPILLQHDPKLRVGVATKLSKSDALEVEGELLSSEEAAKLAADADDGFPFQASIGFSIQRVVRLEEGDSQKVNGRKFEGPGLIIEKSELNEVSFVPVGADRNTSAVVLADQDGDIEIEAFGDKSMSKEETKTADAPGKAELEAQVKGAREEALKEERERVAALKKEFADRPEFALSQIEKGSTVAEAKVELADVLKEELADRDKKIEELQKKSAKSAETDGADGVEQDFSGGGAGWGGKLPDPRNLKVSIDDVIDAHIDAGEKSAFAKDFDLDKDHGKRAFAAYLREERRIAEVKAARAD